MIGEERLCPKCESEMDYFWNPYRHSDDNPRMKCRNPKCGYEEKVGEPK